MISIPTLIIGAGNWGTAFSLLLDSQKSKVSLWTRNSKIRKQIQDSRINQEYLPESLIPKSVHVVNDLKKTIPQHELFIIALPSHTIREFLAEYKSLFPKNALFLNLSKGVENPGGLRLSEIFSEIMGGHSNWATLSGPNLASEIAAGLPAVAVIASQSHSLAEKLQEFISSETFRVYTNPDLAGVEICGALKNVIAIGAGICHGLGLGNNAVSALITRGIAEITRYGLRAGADPLTFMGLAGLGDLTVTCMSTSSRNHTLGYLIAKGQTLEEAVKTTRMVAEGINTCRTISKVAHQRKIYMPIVQGVAKVLFEGLSPHLVVQELMAGSLKSEKVDF